MTKNQSITVLVLLSESLAIKRYWIILKDYFSELHFLEFIFSEADLGIQFSNRIASYAKLYFYKAKKKLRTQDKKRGKK